MRLFLFILGLASVPILFWLFDELTSKGDAYYYTTPRHNTANSRLDSLTLGGGNSTPPVIKVPPRPDLENLLPPKETVTNPDSKFSGDKKVAKINKESLRGGRARLLEASPRTAYDRNKDDRGNRKWFDKYVNELSFRCGIQGSEERRNARKEILKKCDVEEKYYYYSTLIPLLESKGFVVRGASDLLNRKK